MTTGDDQGYGRESILQLWQGLEGLLALHPGGVDVGMDMIDADQRDSPGQREALGGAESHQQRPDQAGAVGDGNRIDIRRGGCVTPAPGILEASLHQAGDDLHMRPAGDLRHDTAEALMQGHLAEHAVGQDPVAIFDDGDTGLITGSFNSEDFHIGDIRLSGKVPVTCQHRSTKAKEQANAGCIAAFFFLAPKLTGGSIDKSFSLWLNDASHLAEFSA